MDKAYASSEANYYTTRLKGIFMGLKIFLGSPCYDAMEPEFVGSLIASMDALHNRGHELCDWGYVKGTLPHFARIGDMARCGQAQAANTHGFDPRPHPGNNPRSERPNRLRGVDHAPRCTWP